MKPLDYQQWPSDHPGGRAIAIAFHLVVLNLVLPVGYRLGSGALAWLVPGYGGSLAQMGALLAVGLALQIGNGVVWWRYRGPVLALGVAMLIGVNVVSMLVLGQIAAFVALESLPLIVETATVLWGERG